MKDILKVLWKEFRVSLLCGVLLGIASFIKTLLINSGTIASSGQNAVMVALVVSISLLLTVIIAKLIGCSLPMLAKKLGFDPAVMASPFITTIVDAVSLIVFFQTAVSILNI